MPNGACLGVKGWLVGVLLTMWHFCAKAYSGARCVGCGTEASTNLFPGDPHKQLLYT